MGKGIEVRLNDSTHNSLLNIMGNRSKFIDAATLYEGHIHSIQIREDETVIDILTDPSGTSLLSTLGLTARTLYTGEFITNGLAGFGSVRTSAKTLKLNI